MTYPGVSAVIPSFNCKEKLFRLLNSLKKSDYPNLEIIVVDNGSKDSSLREGKRKYKWVRWVNAGKENIGQAGCYNLGFAHAKKDHHILYVDSDVVVEKQMIKNLAKRIENQKKTGIVTPMILYLEDKNWVNQAGAHVNLVTGKVTVGWGPKKDFLKAKPVQNSGTVMLIKRQVVERIGAFDHWFNCYLDPDYCLRAKKAGFKTWYEPKAIAYHDQPKDPNLWRPRVLSRAYLLGRNRVLFMRRHGNMFTFTLFLPLILGYYFLETLRYKQLKKFIELVKGSVAGYLYPLSQDNYIPLPSIDDGEMDTLTGFNH